MGKVPLKSKKKTIFCTSWSWSAVKELPLINSFTKAAAGSGEEVSSQGADTGDIFKVWCHWSCARIQLARWIHVFPTCPVMFPCQAWWCSTSWCLEWAIFCAKMKAASENHPKPVYFLDLWWMYVHILVLVNLWLSSIISASSAEIQQVGLWLSHGSDHVPNS